MQEKLKRTKEECEKVILYDLIILYLHRNHDKYIRL